GRLIRLAAAQSLALGACSGGADDLFFFQAEDGIRDFHVTGVQTCALPISQMDTRRIRGCASANRDFPCDSSESGNDWSVCSLCIVFRPNPGGQLRHYYFDYCGSVYPCRYLAGGSSGELETYLGILFNCTLWLFAGCHRYFA